MDAGSDCGAVNMGTGLLVDQDKVPDGREMVRRFMEHLVRNEEKYFNQVVLPLSCPILSPCPETQWGVKEFDLRRVIPKNLESYVEDVNGWKGSLVCAPSYTKIKNENFLCGKVVVHMFGRKVRLRIDYFLIF